MTSRKRMHEHPQATRRKTLAAALRKGFTAGLSGLPPDDSSADVTDAAPTIWYVSGWLHGDALRYAGYRAHHESAAATASGG